jgi:uncharacterized Fe-S radical SAM superfamily protein PflX
MFVHRMQYQGCNVKCVAFYIQNYKITNEPMAVVSSRNDMQSSTATLGKSVTLLF